MVIRLAIVLLIICGSTSLAEESLKTNSFNFKFTSIDNEPLPLASFKGKAVLIVNTASKCGFTRQYSELQSLWDTYKEQGLVVLAVPSNDFGGQEPASESEIKSFCSVNFDIDFPMTSKTMVKGSEAHPFFVWAQTQFGALAKPRWNFHKYLVSPTGELVDWFSSPTSPLSKRVVNAVVSQLPKKNF